MRTSQIILILLLIIVVGVGVRSYELTARSMWFDEAFSWRLAQFPLPELIKRAAQDVHPPLYDVVLKGWTAVFGHSLAALRGLSVVFAAATIGAAYLFGTAAARSRAAGLTLAAFVALASWQIQAAWEARMYTQGTFLTLISSWLLLTALRARPARLVWWMAYSVVAAAFAYTHYFAFFSLAAQAIFVCGWLAVETRWRFGELLHHAAARSAAVAAVIGAIMYVPWLPIFWQQHRQVQQAFWIPPLNRGSVPATLYRSWWPAGSIRHDNALEIVIASLPLIATSALVVWLMLAAWQRVAEGLFNPRRANEPAAANDGPWLVAASIITPFSLAILTSLVGRSLYQDRFFVFAHVYILAALAMVIVRIPWRWLRQVALATALAGLTVAFVAYWRELEITQRPGTAAATRFLFEQRQRDEPILVSSPFVFFAVRQYAAEEYQDASPRLYSNSGELAHFAGAPILTTTDLVDATSIRWSELVSFWVIDTTGFGGQPLPVPPSHRAQVTSTWPEVFAYQGTVTATRYVRRPGS